MNVFVLNTGRCGSLTFARACGHATNFTTAHESRVARLGDDRLAFPEHHIEIDNRLFPATLMGSGANVVEFANKWQLAGANARAPSTPVLA